MNFNSKSIWVKVAPRARHPSLLLFDPWVLSKKKWKRNPVHSLKLWLTLKDVLLRNKPISSLQLGAVSTEIAAKTPVDLKHSVFALHRSKNAIQFQRFGGRPTQVSKGPGSLSSLQVYILMLVNEKVIQNKQHGFTKYKWHLTSLIDFYFKITGVVEEERTMDFIYPDFGKAKYMQYCCTVSFIQIRIL